jgi:hypothetical protein
MKMSEKLNDLFAALPKFQGELENASKGKQGHGYKYADLAECINVAKPHLAANGLAVSQMLGSDDQGKQTMITLLTHSSGQWISSEFVMVNAVLQGGSGKNPAQVLGSAITYQRRYAYAAIIGLAQEDDDAASASGSPRAQNNQAQQKNWYNGFENDKQGMIDHLNNGGSVQDIIDNLAGQGLSLSKETIKKIQELAL